jgi:hypothetical protein
MKQLNEYVEAGQIEVSPKTTHVGRDGLCKRGRRRSGDACNLDAV